jgi:hypothetical protein
VEYFLAATFVPSPIGAIPYRLTATVTPLAVERDRGWLKS